MIRELKIYDAITCKEDESIVNVANLMKDKSARHIYVEDYDKKPVGIIAAMDVVSKVVAESKDLGSTMARDVMSHPVDCVDLDQEEEFAMKVMLERKTYACLVTENGMIKGLVDYKDVMEKIAEKVKQDES